MRVGSQWYWWSITGPNARPFPEPKTMENDSCVHERTKEKKKKKARGKNVDYTYDPIKNQNAECDIYATKVASKNPREMPQAIGTHRYLAIAVADHLYLG